MREAGISAFFLPESVELDAKHTQGDKADAIIFLVKLKFQ